MSAIDDLWDDGKLPIRDALHFSGGGSYDVVRDPYVLGCLGVREAFDLPKLLAEAPTWLSSIGALIEAPLKGGDLLWGGEGSHGSDGFFARVRPDETLVWAVFFMDSNPFEEGIQVSGTQATFHSSAEISFTVDIDDPRHPVTPRRARPFPFHFGGGAIASTGASLTGVAALLRIAVRSARTPRSRRSVQRRSMPPASTTTTTTTTPPQAAT